MIKPLEALLFIVLALVAGACCGTWANAMPCDVVSLTNREAVIWSTVAATWDEDETLKSGARSCRMPHIRWAETQPEAAQMCSYAPESGAHGCFRAPSPRKPYLVMWRNHPNVEALLAHEMVHALQDCLGQFDVPPEYSSVTSIAERGRSAWTHRDIRLWGTFGVEKNARRAFGNLTQE